MPNYASEFLLKPSNTVVKLKDESAQNSITNLTGDLQTEVSNRRNADTQLQNNIDDEELARQQGDTQLQRNINTLSSAIGSLSNLDTNAKDSIVNAINELNTDIENFESDLMHYVYVENYLVDGATATQALKQAIADCPSKGTVILPNQTLTITETIEINKPLTLKGLRHGYFQIEGGNNFTPNSDYITFDLDFRGVTNCIKVASPSVELSDISIEIDNSFAGANNKVIELTSATGDNLNMPRDIRMTNVYILNVDYPTTVLPKPVYGIYSQQPVLLSKFNNVNIGFVSYGFYFEANINTSLTFINCGCSVANEGYYIKNATYSVFIRCGCESPCTNGFHFISCKSISLISCFCEQVVTASFFTESCLSMAFIGCFCTSGILIKSSLSAGSIISCYASYTSTLQLPWLSLYGSYMKLLGISDCFITTDNGQTAYRIGYSDKVPKWESQSMSEFTATGFTINFGQWSVVDNHISIQMEITTTAVSGTLAMPAYMLPLVSKYVPLNPQGWATITRGSSGITFNFGATGTVFKVDLEFESIATQ